MVKERPTGTQGSQVKAALTHRNQHQDTNSDRTVTRSRLTLKTRISWSTAANRSPRSASPLASQGWRVRPRRRYLIVWADCEDDAKGLVRALSGDGRADADMAFRVGRVSYSYMLYDPFN